MPGARLVLGEHFHSVELTGWGADIEARFSYQYLKHRESLCSVEERVQTLRRPGFEHSSAHSLCEIRRAT